MKLRFGKARHGWLPTVLETDGEELLFDVSYMPYDFVGELVTALSGVLDAPGEYVARICEEPPEHDWRFESSDASAVSFRIVSYPKGRRTKSEAEVTAETWGAPLDIVLPFWRGLRELASRARDEAFGSHWNEPFPFEALERLTVRVEQARSAGGAGHPGDTSDRSPG